MKNPLTDYIRANPHVKKNYIAERLNISKQTLSAWLKRPADDFKISEVEKIKALK